MKKDWGDYCVEVSGIKDKHTARCAFDRMLAKFFPRELPKPETPLLPSDKFSVIYADPPWKYKDELIEEYGAAVKHYPVMSIEEICEIDVKSIVDNNSVLFLWVTSPILKECWPVIEACGFEYKASFIWDKVKHNYGHYNSVRHEFLLIATKGSYLPENDELHDSVITYERDEIHSHKPEYFRTDIIDKLYPSGKAIELFSRKKKEELPERWEVWGHEI